MYQDNGINEFASVCNVTFRGIEVAGSFAKNSAKAFLRICQFIMAAAEWAKNKAKDYQYNKSGKKSQKVMKDKFQGEVLYGKIDSPRETVRKQDGSNKNFTEEQLKKLPDNQWIEKRFEQLAKRHGLEYCLMPNLSKDPQGLFVQYPKMQENIFQEIMAELQEEIRKECELAFKKIDKENEVKCEEAVKDCKTAIEDKEKELQQAKENLKIHHKIGDKVGEQKYGELIVVLQDEIKKLKEHLKELIEKWNFAREQTGKDIVETLSETSKEVVKGKVFKPISQMQYLEQSGLLNASDKEFDEAMQKAFPEEYSELQKELSKNSKSKETEYLNDSGIQKKKKEFVRRMNQGTRAAAQKNGLTHEFTINAAEYVKNADKTASFPHPDYPEFMVTISTKNVCGFVDDSKMKQTKKGQINGSINVSVYKEAALEFRVPVLDAATGMPVKDAKGNPKFEKMKMTYDGFDKMVKETGITAAVAMKQKRRELDRLARQKKRAVVVKQKGAVNAKK